MSLLKSGDTAPNFSAPDETGRTVESVDYKGRRLFVFFYPKAGTSGWVTQAKSVRDTLQELEAKNIAVLGISPDLPEKQRKMAEKHELGFPLLSDPEHFIAEAFGVWGEKKMYGKTYMGIIRSAFLIDDACRIAHAWYKISPKKTVPELLKVL